MKLFEVAKGAYAVYYTMINGELRPVRAITRRKTEVFEREELVFDTAIEHNMKLQYIRQSSDVIFDETAYWRYISKQLGLTIDLMMTCKREKYAIFRRPGKITGTPYLMSVEAAYVNFIC